MANLERVHPRLRQRRAAVDFRRTEKIYTDCDALIDALKNAIDYLDRQKGTISQNHIRMTTALYRWALSELEASVRTESTELSLIYTVCKRLSGTSHELARGMSNDRGDRGGPHPMR